GKNFALTAAGTFGRRGYVVPSGFLATVVIGWFAFQTGLTGSILHNSLGWNEKLTTLAAGVGFTAVTLLGIRALSVIGMIAAPVYLVLGALAIAFAASAAAPGSITSYQGGAGNAALSLGAAVTLVIASFIDSGTMTSDFTRWARNGREGFLAAFSAFPVGNAIAMIVGGVIVALGAAADPGSNGGAFLDILIARGGVLVPLAVAFVFINLGSVCAHCLYNGAVGWGQLSGGTMRRLTLVLGALGVLLAVAGIWSYFGQWLNLLGVIVPPIGVVLILDQLILPRFGLGSRAAGAPPAAFRWEPFASWAAGSAAALLAHQFAPWLSDAIIGMVVAAAAYTAACAATKRSPALTPSPPPAMDGARA
ncbi:MAG TPA: cytosine permease, partial [Pseudonocardiaceae bacterium]|nr:cytosine permease [Pseudonocardiaceae bacterium]